MTDPVESFQLSADAAETYESKFVPAMFAEWAPRLVDAGGVAPGQRVLDVACGTGVVARQVADRLAGDGTVVGVDLNEAMLAVARRLRPDIEWRQGDASDLPFPDRSFDVVLCQAALMFFPDRAKAIGEMARVAADEGTVAIHVWASLDDQPGYTPLVDVAARHAGPEAVGLLGSYWTLGDLDLVTELFEGAGLGITARHSHLGLARFDSIDDFVRTEVEGTPLVERISDEVYERILEDAREALGRFRTDAGTGEIPIRGHVIAARKG